MKERKREEKHLQYMFKLFLPTSPIFFFNVLTSSFFHFFLETNQQNRKVLSINYTHDTLIVKEKASQKENIREQNKRKYRRIEKESEKIQFVDIKPNQSINSSSSSRRMNVCLLFDRIH